MKSIDAAVVRDVSLFKIFFKKKSCSCCKVQADVNKIQYLLSNFPCLQNVSAACWMFSITGRLKAAVPRWPTYSDLLKKYIENILPF